MRKLLAAILAAGLPILALGQASNLQINLANRNLQDTQGDALGFNVPTGWNTTWASGSTLTVAPGATFSAASIGPTNINGVVNVKAPPYNATGNGVTDDTAAIQSAINAAVTGARAIYFPAGNYSISSLNFTGVNPSPDTAFNIFTDGTITVNFIANTSGKNVMDFSNAGGVNIFGGFQMLTAGGVVAKTGMLFACSAAHGAVAGESINGVSIQAAFSVATVYIYGTDSSSMRDCQFFNNYAGAANTTFYMTATNRASITSDFITVGTGTEGVSDWTFTNCEVHDFSNNASSTPFILDSTDSIRWYGGNISCFNTGNNELTYVETFGTCTNTIFDGATMYSDGGHPLGVGFYFTGAITDFECRKANLQATGSMFAANAVAISGFDYRGECPATSVFGNGNAATVTDSYIVCHGGQINIGTGSITKSVLIDPGTVTATTDSSLHITSTGISAPTLNGDTFTPGSYTLTGVAGKTLTFSNSLTLAGTDSTTMTFPSTSATIARTDSAQTFTGINSFGSQIQASVGSAGAPGYSFTGHTNFGMHYTTNTLHLDAGAGGDVIQLTNSLATIGEATSVLGTLSIGSLGSFAGVISMADGGASGFAMNIQNGDTLTANRLLTISVNDAAQTLSLTGNATLNQNVSTTGSPVFVALNSTPIGSGTPSTGAFTTISASSTSALSGNTGIGVSANASFTLDIAGTQTGNNTAGIFFSPTLVANASNQIFYGFTGATNLNTGGGSFTGLTAYGFQYGTPVNSGNGTIANEYQFELLNGSASTSLVGLAIASQTAGTSNNTDLLVGATSIPTGTFGIYQGDTRSDFLGGKFTTYNNATTAGQGVAVVVAVPRQTAVTNTTATLATYTVPAADSTYRVSANVQVTAATTAAMTVVCTYTDETNTSRAQTIPFCQLAGTFLTSITNVTGVGPYEGATLEIRCKAGTTIVFTTAGTVTGITYNVQGSITQLN